MNFKPNIYPVIFWAVSYGAAAALLVFVAKLLLEYINIFGPLVFLAGVVLGAWRNYRKQKNEFYANSGQAPAEQSPMDEFRAAARDIASASQELMNQEAPAEEVVEEEIVYEEPPVETQQQEVQQEELPPEEPPVAPPTPPTTPQPPTPPAA